MPDDDPRASQHREVERKFDVAESAAPPSYRGVAGVTRVERLPAQQLEAVYFDTPAHDLAGRGITLRRRTGGADAGWHLKLPAGADTRTEVRLPAGDADGQVPAELLDLVLAIVRDRPLAPVAQIGTTREVHLLHGDWHGDADAVLAQFCDDRVTASPCSPGADRQRWREWELELASAEPDTDLLDRLSSPLLDSGARPATHGSKLARTLGSPPAGVPADPDPVRRALAEQVEALLAADRAVRADADDAVHQMRVSIRRIRSLLRAFAADFGLTGDAEVLDELRGLAGVLGEARDAEVLGLRHRQALDRLPPELIRGPVRHRLLDGPRRSYTSGLRRSLELMRSPRYFRLLDTLDALMHRASTGDRPAGGGVESAYQQVCKAAAAAGRAAGAAERDQALHRIRKRSKRLRYVAAATGETAIAERAKAIQALLGEHQDSVVSREHLLAEARAAGAAGEDTFTYGVLYQQEREIARDCRARLDQALDELAESMTEGGRAGL